MYNLTEGALDEIMNGVEIDKPIFQILGHKQLAGSGSQQRYRLLVSDGIRINSFAMLATQLNNLITDGILSDLSVCQINRYAISTVNNSGKARRVMVILSIDVKVPGDKVGSKIGNPTHQDGNQQNESTAAAPTKPSAAPASEMHGGNVRRPVAGDVAQRSGLNDSISMGSDITTTPIVALSPYHNRWVIKVRVTNKSSIRTWSNSRGDGKLFSMDFLDETGEIRATAFNNTCDKYYDMIEVGKVYYVSRCSLKAANKQFNNLKNDYEMSFRDDTEVVVCHDEACEIPAIQFDFVRIADIDAKQKDDIVDVLGVCKSFSDVQTLVARSTGKELRKREVNLIDESNTMVSLTLWGTQAEEFNGTNNPIVALKGGRLSEFNGGKSIGALGSSILQINPDIPEAHRLQGWFNSTGSTEEMRSISKGSGAPGGLNGPWMSFKEAKDQQLGSGDAPDYFIVKATINMLRTENCLYKACPTEQCNKKVIDHDDEMYRCEKCNRNFPNFKYRLLASANLADWTDNQWATAFSKEGEQLLGLTTQELGELKENDNDMFLEKFGDAAFKSFLLKLRVKMESFSDETRLKTTVVNAVPLDFKTYNAHLITKIKELANISKA